MDTNKAPGHQANQALRTGLGAGQWALWNATRNHDLGVLLGSAMAVSLLQRMVDEVLGASLQAMPEFSLNLALLHSWLARHQGQPATSDNH
ncbi:hypothetical protein WR25_01088 [Diploscapter pachys]|uniref:Uncharacterized protein n=1 Tax=Diploscapter pachys TaxID=2018661 RepID=A0A2A2KA08_9BILA|nr:hypothetical protein WR25_01088 [Diploscapter pachys]